MRQAVVYRDVEDGGWVAEVPSLPGCVAQGETKEEALRNAAEAIRDWTSAAASAGRIVPNDAGDAQIVMIDEKM